MADSSAILAGCEVRIEQRVVFKLDLPNRKVIAVKSKCTKNLVDVLKPILNKYNYRLDEVSVTTMGGAEPVDILLPVTSVDGARLNIQLRDRGTLSPVQSACQAKMNSSLDEITNRVFKELLQEKADAKSKTLSDRASVKVLHLCNYRQASNLLCLLERGLGLRALVGDIRPFHAQGLGHV